VKSLASLGIFLTMVVVAAALSGRFVGGEWYLNMHQPSWNPSAMVMASVWAVVYVLMAVSAWLVWDNRRDQAFIALAWWLFQLLLGIGWSWAYFGQQRVGWALALMTLWVLAVLIVVNAFRFVKTQASVLMAPVAGWLLFSWLLNFVQWHLNGGGSG
jgi:benzodiazapine receptor